MKYCLAWACMLILLPQCYQVMLRVTDLDRSIKFYTEALGMTLIRTRDNPDNKYKLAFLGRVPCHHQPQCPCRAKPKFKVPTRSLHSCYQLHCSQPSLWLSVAQQMMCHKVDESRSTSVLCKQFCNQACMQCLFSSAAMHMHVSLHASSNCSV